MRILGFVIAALLLWAPQVRAQDFEAAAKHFSAAQDAFGKRHYHAAAAEFQLAFEITKDPVLLYNIGEAWQKAGDGRKSVAAYKSYLKVQPTAQDRADVQRRIKSIEAKRFKLADQSAHDDGATPPVVVAEAPAPSPMPAAPVAPQTLTPDFDAPPAAAPEAAAAPPGVAPPPAVAPAPAPAPVADSGPGILDDQPASKLRVAAWVSLAATVAVLTAGAIFGLSAQSRADEISRRFTFVDTSGQPSQFDAAAQKDYHDLKSDGRLYNNLAIGFFSGAGALAITTVVLFVVDYKRPAARHAWRLAPTVGKDAAGVTAGWSF